MPEQTETKVGIIVLAAGYSRRFNSDKRQVQLDSGEMLLDSTLNNIPDSFFQRVLVMHPGDEAFAQRYQPDWTICIAELAEKGMGHSLAAAMTHTGTWDAAVIALADMPYVQNSTYQSIQDALAKHAIVRPICQGRLGNPVGFQASYFEEIAKLEGDQGARELLTRHADDLYLLECADWGIIQDIDTVNALNNIDD